MPPLRLLLTALGEYLRGPGLRTGAKRPSDLPAAERARRNRRNYIAKKSRAVNRRRRR